MSLELATFLHACKLRLLNVNQANRSLRLPRLLPGRELDVHTLAWHNGLRPQAILEAVLMGQSVQLLSPQAAADVQQTRLQRSLTELYRHLELTAQETGAYDLYLGYPFLEGRFQDGTELRAPVLRFPVRLVRGQAARGGWALQPRHQPEGLLNEAAFRALEKCHELPLTSAFWQPDLPRTDWRALINALYAHFKAHRLPIDFSSSLFALELHRWVDYLPETMALWPEGQLRLLPQAVLGCFPTYDSALLQDYQALDAAPQDFPLATLLSPQPTAVATPPLDGPTALPLDYSQRVALRKVQAGHSLVVQGPPGTGKSQLIAALVADALAHGKRVLVVSEKRAALDVVHKRLQGLGLADSTALVHDFRADRDRIYAQLARAIEALSQPADEAAAPPTATVAALVADYQQLLAATEDAHHALEAPLPCGYSPHALYAMLTAAPAEPLNPPQLAQGLTRHILPQLLLLAERCRVYAPLLDPAHPWYARTPIPPHDAAFLQGQRAWVEALQAATAQAAQHWQATCHQGRGYADEPNLPQQLAQLQALDASLRADPALADALQAWLQDPQPTTALTQAGETLYALHTALAALHLLTPADYHRLADLQAACAAYLARPAWQGIWHQAWRVARAALRRHLRQQGVPFRKDNIALLHRQLVQAQALLAQLAESQQPVFWQALGHPADGTLWQQRLAQRVRALQWLQGSYLSLQALPHCRPQLLPNGQLDWPAWKAQLDTVATWPAHQAAWLHYLQQCSHWLSPALADQLAVAIRHGGTAAARMAKALHSAYAPQPMAELDALLADQPAHMQALVRHLGAQQRWQAPDWAEAFTRQVHASWLALAVQERPLLAASVRADHAVHTRQLQQLEDHLRTVWVQWLAHSRITQLRKLLLPDGTLPDALRELYHQLTKKRRVWPLRQLISHFWFRGLDAWMPCVLASPETVAAAFPMQADLFDLVVVDEASQCPTERVLTTLLRGMQWVIAGDRHQLPPMDLFQVQVNTEALLAAQVDGLYALGSAIDSESILDLAAQRMPHSSLWGHYRSQHPALIAFSSKVFYQDKLQCLPPLPHRSLFLPPICYHHLPGKWEDQCNAVEADAVVRCVEALLLHPGQPTLGIVTFNHAQMVHIQDALDARIAALLRTDAAAAMRLAAARERTEQGAYVGLFVKNIENVQGDERDIILFSVGYAPQAGGKVPATFGWLNQAGGQNRLNVAITRARHQVQLFCSFLPEQLEVAHTRHPGPRLLKAYLRYAHAVSAGQQAVAVQVLQEVGATDAAVPQAAQPPDALVQLLCAQLVIAGLPAQVAPPYAHGLCDIWVADAGRQLGVLVAQPAHGAGRVSVLDAPYRLRQAGAAVLRLHPHQLWADLPRCVHTVREAWEALH